MARVRNAGSSLAAYLPRMPLMDSASMRAWAGSYTPQGRSQCAETTVLGVIRRRSESMRVASFPTDGADDQILRPYPRGSGRCMGRQVTMRALHWGRVLVSGSSMEPGLSDGDMLLVRYGARVRPADVVVVVLPGDRPLAVKRAVYRCEDGWWVEGDAPASSTDSRQLGPVPESAVRGRAVLRYWPRPRRLS